jgi:hypothetical protein
MELVIMFHLVNETQETLKGADGEPMAFETFVAAKEYAGANAPSYGPRKVRVVVRWQDREAKRLTDGTYQPLPEGVTDAWEWDTIKTAFPEHFAHMSKKQPGKVAFTESDKKGEGDVQTPLTFAEYVQRFAQTVPGGGYRTLLSSGSAEKLNSLWALSVGTFSLKFIENSHDMGVALSKMNGGPLHSCMTGFSPKETPYRVYGTDEHEGVASDLTLATLFDDATEAYSARCLVWAGRKRHGRTYGPGEAILRKHLQALGYVAGEFEGAKLKRIEDNDDTFVMPYLDGIQGVSDHGDCFVITWGGEYCADTTPGYISEEERYYCESCEESVSEIYSVIAGSGGSEQSWCECCRDNHAFYCEGGGDYHSDDLISVEVNGRTYSQSYADNHFSFCDHTDEWVNETQTVIVNRRGHEENWCADAIEEDAFTCRVDDKVYHNDLLSPHMESDEGPICILNDERDIEFHRVPGQGELPLEAPKAATEGPLEVGTWVEIVGECFGDPESDGYKGALGVIVQNGGSDIPYYVRLDADQRSRWFRASSVIAHASTLVAA